jgi:hypothetical protein
LDGTQPVYYVSLYGNKASSKKFIIYFEGGGWCYSDTVNGTIASCYARSKGDLGSSKNYNETISDFWGILSGNPDKNPKFWDWNRIFVKYCDGTGHQGYAKNPVNYNGTDIYFRGYNNTVATIR